MFPDESKMAQCHHQQVICCGRELSLPRNNVNCFNKTKRTSLLSTVRDIQAVFWRFGRYWRAAVWTHWLTNSIWWMFISFFPPHMLSLAFLTLLTTISHSCICSAQNTTVVYLCWCSSKHSHSLSWSVAVCHLLSAVSQGPNHVINPRWEKPPGRTSSLWI